MNDLVPPNLEVAPAFRHLDPNQSMADGIAAGFPVIGYKGKVWSLRLRGEQYNFVRPDDGTPAAYIDMVVIGSNPVLSKQFYPPPYREDSSGPPICSSLNHDVPDPGVSAPQAKSCSLCANDVWQMQPNGRMGRACKDYKRLAVLLMPAMTKKLLGSPLMEPVLFPVPAGSLSALKLYNDSLRDQGIPFAATVTRVTFAPDKQFQMLFRWQQMLTDREADVVLPLIEDTQTRRITGTQSNLRLLPSPPAEAGVEEEDPRVETGIMEAFGGRPAAVDTNEPEPMKRRGGRPPGSRNKPKSIEAIVQATAPKPVNTPEPKSEPAVNYTLEPEPGPTAGSWDESDSNLDQEVLKLFGQKVQDMLK